MTSCTDATFCAKNASAPVGPPVGVLRMPWTREDVANDVCSADFQSLDGRFGRNNCAFFRPTPRSMRNAWPLPGLAFFLMKRYETRSELQELYLFCCELF